MNRSIRFVAGVAALLFFALLAGISFNYVVRSDSLNNHANNRRVRDAEFTQPRGAILVSNSPIAQTVPSEGQFARTRTYANGPLYAPLTGFYSYTYGRSGLEQRFNTQLTGTDDSQFIGNLLDTIAGRHPEGASLQTTINARAQQAAWDALGGRRGAVVAMDYRTGAVLAYVSSPSYDPNALAGADIAATQEAWAALNADPNRPMADRATREIYPPGSIFKLVTAAAALEEGLTPETMVDSPANMQLPETEITLGNWGSCGGDRVTIRQALTVSCNTAFANLGLTLGADALRTQAESFGFGTAFTGDFASATSVFPANPDRPQTAMSAIGQFEVAATPLQIASMTAAIANDGVQMQPYIVAEVRNPDLSVLSQHHPNQLRTSMSVANAQAMKSMMTDVITKGTGRNANIEGMTMGAKTGTAQSDLQRPDYAWFSGWSDENHVVVTVFVEDAQDPEDIVSGGRNAAPIGKAVFEALR